ncbi:hypothetical protein [Bifidobacterium sp. SO1]|uniref:hypothetical protein n=1 Tax=Bifidobacterium sp. SO1 TaxID=2809029 RepID=UPI001BDBF57E|nr:hypothetical protein [Bifidobacterium sp. SO1]MBT1162565.1 hypothetical protein [Bifidobacterium sp. SO1]
MTIEAIQLESTKHYRIMRKLNANNALVTYLVVGYRQANDPIVWPPDVTVHVVDRPSGRVNIAIREIGRPVGLLSVDRYAAIVDYELRIRVELQQIVAIIGRDLRSLSTGQTEPVNAHNSVNSEQG